MADRAARWSFPPRRMFFKEEGADAAILLIPEWARISARLAFGMGSGAEPWLPSGFGFGFEGSHGMMGGGKSPVGHVPARSG